MTLPADIEAAIADLIMHAQEAGRTTGHAHALTAIARVSLETIIAAHLRGMAEMKAALEAQTSGA
ncbi:hypothetical protein [Methylobacterium persicinum]|uniref:DUF2732 domain-containing protein n=1 Tax=Methylobacterium persicinum TaxID=374426 RepID=A0ABU0HS82_9HYPH|nr:hypothetical protein [Methylobacterium persicinum]MDQ0445204.1 hypothetical protein [Methylobacterium persicinum]GJE37831.1 hypothetical protein KHHGKMAE_1893 [Methylobacterium persicinum]